MPGAGLRARGVRIAAPPPGGRSFPPTRRFASLASPAAVRALATTMLLTVQAPGQAVAADGFAAVTSFGCHHQAHLLRSVLPLDQGQHYVVQRRRLYRTGGTLEANRPPLFELRKEDIAFCARSTQGGRLYVGGLSSGLVYVLDETTGLRLFEFQGLANTFAVEPLTSDRLLVQANPTWPAGNANSGLWLVEPGQSPRLLLQLVGPSAPIARGGNGDLVVAELGTIVPPPPGAARLLRFPAAAVQAAIAGGTLTTSQAGQIGTGFVGIYDLAVDDDDRVYVSDPASSVVLRTAPGGLDAVEAWFDAGPGRYVTGLHWLPGAGAPFAPHQPGERAPSLRVTCGDYWTVVEQFAVGPGRPAATLAPSPGITSGSQLLVYHAPRNGTGLVLVALGSGAPEVPFAWPGSPPLWLGLDPSQLALVVPFVVDGAGCAAVPLPYAGGLDLTITLQAAILAADGAIATTAPLTTDLLP